MIFLPILPLPLIVFYKQAGDLAFQTLQVSSKIFSTRHQQPPFYFLSFSYFENPYFQLLPFQKNLKIFHQKAHHHSFFVNIQIFYFLQPWELILDVFKILQVNLQHQIDFFQVTKCFKNDDNPSIQSHIPFSHFSSLILEFFPLQTFALARFLQLIIFWRYNLIYQIINYFLSLIKKKYLLLKQISNILFYKLFMKFQQLNRFFSTTVLKKDSNQAHQLGKYAIAFMQKGQPSAKVLERCRMFHTDSVVCGLSALALKTNAPHVLRDQALQYSLGKSSTLESAKVFGSNQLVPIQKAIAANSSAVREWDSNGTVFGYDKDKSRQAGQFGHNDFYPVVIAASHVNPKIDGAAALKAMVLQDQIRGRLCQVFSLKSYKIDHVVHGGIASICTYGALVGASPVQIEHAIGMLVAHYIPWRAIRAGKQLSDSKGASAAITTQAAMMCIKRAMRGFVGPKDIFRNPEAIFRQFERTNGDCPFDITLSNEGDDFAVMGMHFKLGLYEHQSAGALEGLQKMIYDSKFTTQHSIDEIENINIVAYEPAFGIIGDPAKKTPSTRQSADHSMVYIISTMLRKAFENKDFGAKLSQYGKLDEVWKSLMLEPKDYGHKALFNQKTRNLMTKCTFTHGGKEYDEKYPEGIPTSISITLKGGKKFESGFVMFPSGHSRNSTANLHDILNYKNNLLGRLALSESDLKEKLSLLNDIEKASNKDLQNIYTGKINVRKFSVDEAEFTD